MNEMTEAMKKVQEQRDLHNAGRARIVAKDFSAVVYLYERRSDQAPCAVGYRGRALKHSFRLRFGNEQARADYVAKWMKEQVKVTQRRKAVKRSLQPGDVLRAMWGYDQTNIDFFLVLSLKGAQSVEIVEIGQEVAHTESLHGTCIPNKKKIIGEPMVKRANGDRVRINSAFSASKLEPKEVAGCQVYSASHFSNTH